MLGATYFVATLDRPSGPGAPARHMIPSKHEPSGNLSDLIENIAADSLSPMARHLALPLRGDRGEALEKAWEKNTFGALAVPFAELRDSEQAGWRPSLVFSPMLVEDGRRLVISNLNLDFLVRNLGSLLTEEATSPGETAQYSLSGWQFFELFPHATDIPLSRIARLNASFPYITPDTELPTTPSRRVVDAAYYDGFGVNLAALWLFHCRDWLRQHTSGVVLIEVRDEKWMLGHSSEWPRWQRALARFTTPLEGAVHAREASMSFRNDELVSWLSEIFNRPEDQDFFTDVIFEYPGRAPLSWYLPPEDLKGMKEFVQENTPFDMRLRLLKEWWTRREGR
jgi:hypothetical protein